ncbi:hypothetical protein E3U96_10085 [Streptococcus pseudopneumoniae]|nr:hypothetical protein E3U96_10085 [Streptococcus pseudopneumoniae]
MWIVDHNSPYWCNNITLLYHKFAQKGLKMTIAFITRYFSLHSYSVGSFSYDYSTKWDIFMFDLLKTLSHSNHNVV